MDGVLTALQLIGSLIGAVAIIFLAYWSTKWLSKKYNSFGDGRHIKVIERCMIGQDKVLVLAKVKEKVYFLAISSQNVQTIDTLDADGFTETVQNENLPDFSSILKSKLISQLPILKAIGSKEEDNRT